MLVFARKKNYIPQDGFSYYFNLSFIVGLSDGQLKLRGRARQYEAIHEDFLKSIIGLEWQHVNILKDPYDL